MPIDYAYLETSIGDLLLVAESGALLQIQFPNSVRRQDPDPEWRERPSALRPVIKQLREYFTGMRQDFDLELDLRGTPFQRAVWQELEKIPFGTTISYGELASRVGNPKAARAVGAANGQNPIPIVVPCHRVIGSNGTLTGFGGGLSTKEALLELERRARGEQSLFGDLDR